jgi:hypothetical protein
MSGDGLEIVATDELIHLVAVLTQVLDDELTTSISCGAHGRNTNSLDRCLHSQSPLARMTRLLPIRRNSLYGKAGAFLGRHRR